MEELDQDLVNRLAAGTSAAMLTVYFWGFGLMGVVILFMLCLHHELDDGW